MQTFTPEQIDSYIGVHVALEGEEPIDFDAVTDDEVMDRLRLTIEAACADDGHEVEVEVTPETITVTGDVQFTIPSAYWWRHFPAKTVN